MRAEPGQVRIMAPDDRAHGPVTPGMDRQQAFATESMWSGFVRTEPGAMSGWHHHGEYETVFYVLTGRVRLEFGPGGSDAVQAGPGDFIYVPKGAVHREGNPSAEPSAGIVFRTGRGESTINVTGPAPA